MNDALTILAASGVSNGPPEYIPVSDDRVPMDQWGKDHWSTLAYLENRIVDNRGRISHDHMRCHGGRHAFMLVEATFAVAVGGWWLTVQSIKRHQSLSLVGFAVTFRRLLHTFCSPSSARVTLVKLTCVAVEVP